MIQWLFFVFFTILDHSAEENGPLREYVNSLLFPFSLFAPGTQRLSRRRHGRHCTVVVIDVVVVSTGNSLCTMHKENRK